MRVRMLFFAVLLMAVAAAAVSAADVSGKWTAEYQSPDGQTRQSTFTFKVDGAQLTGTVGGARGEAKIDDGKVAGGEISFSVTRKFNDNEFKMLYKGAVSGDEIKFKVEIAGGDRTFEMTAKRAK